VKKRLLINLCLIVLITSLGLIAWLKPGQESTPETRITSLGISVIDSIRIERKNKGNLILKRKDRVWHITQPFNAPALPGKIERLLKISQIKPPVAYPLDESLLKQFGLRTPSVQLHFNNETLSIGKTESVHQRRYTRNGEQLFLLDDTFIHHLTAPAEAYIDTRLFTENIQITGLKTPEIDLQRNSDNIWNDAKKPSNAPAPDAVNMLLDEWRFARAIHVEHKSEEIKGEAITLQLNNKAIHFKLLRQADTVTLISTDSNLAYTLSSDKYKKMTTLPILDDSDA